MKLLPFLAALMTALAGCSGQGQPTSRSRVAPAQAVSGASSAATPAAELPSIAQISGPMFAVLEGASAAQGAQADRVAIVGLDGVARAKATFQPRKAPFLGNVADVGRPPLHDRRGWPAPYSASPAATARRLTSSRQDWCPASPPGSIRG